MISPLIAALRALDPDVTAEEVADVIWLGGLLPEPDRSEPAGGAVPATGREVDAGPGEQSPPPVPDQRLPDGQETTDVSAPPPAPVDDTIDIHLPPHSLLHDQYGVGG